MKKLNFTLLILLITLFSSTGQNVKLKVGMNAPDWTFTDADGKEFTMDSWKGQVLQVNYVDPDVSDLNDPVNDAIKKAKDIDKTIGPNFKGFGIVDCKSTWKPNFLIRTIAGNKAKKFDTTILFDYDGALQKLWDMPKDNYTVVIVDKNRVCRAIYTGEIPASQHGEVIKLISDLEKE